MECGPGTGNKSDILAKPWLAFLWWWLPAIAIVVTAQSYSSGGLRTIVWTVALVVMGTGCLINVSRCGRTHCYVTGPFFLLMAIVTLLYALGVLPLGGHGWSLIGLIILIGAVALSCLPELFFGKYRKGRVTIL